MASAISSEEQRQKVDNLPILVTGTLATLSSKVNGTIAVAHESTQ